MQLKNTIDSVKKRATDFVSQLDCDFYILGTNKYGVNVSQWLVEKGKKFAGYINDYINEDEYNGHPVFNSKDVSFSNSAIVNCVVEGRSIDAENSIKGLTPSSYVDYFALQVTYPDALNEIDFLGDTNSILKNHVKYDTLYDRLNDEESKKHLEAITNFRLSRDIKYLNVFDFRLNSQYFEPFIKLRENPTFIDGGGFDGKTTEYFIKNNSQYTEVFYFEPTDVSYNNSKEYLKEFRDVHLFNNGLWDKQETLFFDDSLGSASKLTESGKIKIDTVAIDEVVNSKVDFIKLDIEGAEIKALIGAKDIIQKYKPTLAVCVYHNQTDFTDIPELILQYVPEYKIYLRHYTQGVFETVMYFQLDSI